ncbi:MAG: hypothetical protein LBH98_00270 [Chitinispirillales bacterium]|nr:hypothetical protein [Chitinispirillales bacterium]
MKNLLIIAFFTINTVIIGCSDRNGKDSTKNGVFKIDIDTTWYITSENTKTFNLSAAEQLAGLAVLVANGNTMFGKTIMLSNDISINGNTTRAKSDKSDFPINIWTAIGSRSNPFKGVFDGDGHTVSGIYVSSPKSDQGFFGWICEATIKNLGLLDLYIDGWDYVGGLAGTNRLSKISNCYATGKVNGTKLYAGGLVGYNDGGAISDSYSNIDVSGNSDVGGLAGSNDAGSIENCYSSGTVAGKTNTGGFVGGNYFGSIVNCYYDKQTSGQSDNEKGEGKTTSEMKQQNTYANWDFTSVWNISGNYPFLRF